MLDGFAGLCRRLSDIDLFGTAGEPMPDGAALAAAIRDAAPLLPHSYRDGYAAPVQAALPRLVRLPSRDRHKLEAYAGAIYQHAAGEAVTQPLNRFLAVVSDLYRSFLDKDKRSDAGVPLAESLPPLAMFQFDGGKGPFTLPVDDVGQQIGGAVGVVSLPASYAPHPILWVVLCHETGGHDIARADPGLLDELGNGMLSALAGVPNDRSISRDELARLWAYWIDEAVADVYGLLNLGPAFVPNLAAFVAALNARASGGGPALRVMSGFAQDDPKRLLDPHPTDILRLHLGIGVIESLAGLSAATRSAYVQQITELAARLASGDTVTIAGFVRGNGSGLQPLQAKVPLGLMQQAARNVGGYIATAKLAALKGHSIQDIETWDDADETATAAIRDALLRGRPIAELGDDAQLLAGATLALLQQPDKYDAVTAALNDALDASFAADPIWGSPPVDAAYMRYADDLTLG